MINTAFKIAVIESEKGWGRKIDDWMICLTYEDALKFEKEFNSKNTASEAPDWYMQVEGDPIPITLSESDLLKLQKEKRIWLSQLKNPNP